MTSLASGTILAPQFPVRLELPPPPGSTLLHRSIERRVSLVRSGLELDDRFLKRMSWWGRRCSGTTHPGAPNRMNFIGRILNQAQEAIARMLPVRFPPATE